ncbi:MAG: glucose-6-phosphate isomerase [Clostridia bacterium]|nr:glucose-6-phosphate isomerase [Clostridia bacterium]
MVLKVNKQYLNGFIGEKEYNGMKPFVAAADKMINEKNGAGNDFLGWVKLPADYDKEEFARIKAAAEKIKKDTDVLLVIGIGGSYLGARAAIEFVKSPMYNNLKRDGTPEIYFIGNSISSTHMQEVLSICEGKDVSVNVISKSGTTTEPALAFRVMKEYLEKKYGKEGAKGRIYATTDKARGTLKSLADREGYECFVIPDDVGGRFSVLTPVGLLPIAAAGIDIDALMKGAQDAMTAFMEPDMEKNPCYEFAAIRNILLRKGRSIEVTVGYEPYLWCFGEWIKQLFGESEGKDNKGLFPTSMIFSTDLHSLGQYLQEGMRTMYETVLWVNKSKQDLVVGEDPENLDGLNFLAGKAMQDVNMKAFQATALAHMDGGVPSVVLELEDASAYSLGYLIYFYEKACAVSGYLLGVNPFDQPGVEAYKKNMFALLGKPGYEDMRAELEAKLK